MRTELYYKDDKLSRVKFKVNKLNLNALLWLFVYKLILDLSYVFVVSKFWNYTGFSLSVDPIKFIESYLLLIPVTFFIPVDSERVSTSILWLFVVISYVPTLTLYPFIGMTRTFVYCVSIFWNSVGFLVKNTRQIYVKRLNKKSSLLMLYIILSVLILLSFVLLCKLCKYAGFHLNFSLSNVYQIRTEYKKANLFLGWYVINWVGYIIDPLLFTIGIIKKKTAYILLATLLQILLFSYTGMKSFLFAIPFVILFIMILSRKQTVIYLLMLFVFITAGSMIIYYVFGNLTAISLFIRRTLLVPAQLSYFYYKFFSVHPHTFLSQHHIFGDLFKYPYTLKPPFLIGEVYFNNPKMSANNGIIADAYMNFGYFGFIIWSVILFITLKIIDAFSYHKDIKIALATLLMPTIALINSAFFTTLFTHGLLIAILVLYLLPVEDYMNNSYDQ